jgi:hypothetical protein
LTRIRSESFNIAADRTPQSENAYTYPMRLMKRAANANLPYFRTVGSYAFLGWRASARLIPKTSNSVTKTVRPDWQGNPSNLIIGASAKALLALLMVPADQTGTAVATSALHAQHGTGVLQVPDRDADFVQIH